MTIMVVKTVNIEKPETWQTSTDQGLSGLLIIMFVSAVLSNQHAYDCLIHALLRHPRLLTPQIKIQVSDAYLKIAILSKFDAPASVCQIKAVTYHFYYSYCYYCYYATLANTATTATTAAATTATATAVATACCYCYY